MSLSHHRSGAEKRRRKCVWDKETKAKSQSLFGMRFVSRSDEPSQELALPIDTMEEMSYIGSTNNDVDGIGAEICDNDSNYMKTPLSRILISVFKYFSY